MEIHGFQWISIEIHRILMILHGFQWISMDFNDFHKISIDFNEFESISSNLHGWAWTVRRGGAANQPTNQRLKTLQKQ